MAGYVLSTYREYRIAVLLIPLLALFAMADESSFRIEQIEGNVEIRQGVGESWIRAGAGLILRPEDTIRTGRNSFAVIRRDDGSVYRIPAETILDGADFRNIEREELLLLLAMEDMLSVPDRINDDRPVPRTTVLHGSPRGRTGDISEVDMTGAKLRINGAKFLVGQNYRGAAVLKIRETLRLYPEGEYRTGAMMIAAESLERLELFEEAVKYYRTVIDDGTDSRTRSEAELGLQRIQERKE